MCIYIYIYIYTHKYTIVITNYTITHAMLTALAHPLRVARTSGDFDTVNYM